MAITFNQIPVGTRVPVFFVEIDNTQAVQGLSIQEYNAIIVGQKLAAGTKAEGDVDLVTSGDQAKQFYGNGSILAQQVEAFLANNQSTSLTCVPLADAGGSAAAAGDLDFTGSVATAAGTLFLYLGGRRYQLGVALSDTAATIATAAVALVNADVDRVVDLVDLTDNASVTARNAGEAGNDIDIRVNFFAGEELPAGVTLAITAMAGGTGNPDIDTAIGALDTDKQYHIWAHPWLDASNLGKLEAELSDRFGPVRQLDGNAFGAKRDSFSNLTVLGNARNSPHSTIVDSRGPSNPWEMAAGAAGVVALQGQIDPARPFQTLSIAGVLGEQEAERRTFNERDMLLKDGIASVNTDTGGVVRIERMITTFQLNPLGAPDTSFLDVNTMLTLSFLRFSLRNRFRLRYPRHKLGSDGLRTGPGQAILTPIIAKAEVVSLFREWEDIGLVEGADQFKRDLVVERNSSDPNRLDLLLNPDLLNQFRVGSAQIAFRL